MLNQDLNPLSLKMLMVLHACVHFHQPNSTEQALALLYQLNKETITIVLAAMISGSNFIGWQTMREHFYCWSGCIRPSNSFFVFPYLIWMWYFHIWSKLRFFREIWRGWSNQDILQNQGAYLKQLFHKILPPLGIGPYLITQGWGEQILSYSDIRYSPQPPPIVVMPL